MIFVKKRSGVLILWTIQYKKKTKNPVMNVFPRQWTGSRNLRCSNFPSWQNNSGGEIFFVTDTKRYLTTPSVMYRIFFTDESIVEPKRKREQKGGHNKEAYHLFSSLWAALSWISQKDGESPDKWRRVIFLQKKINSV